MHKSFVRQWLCMAVAAIPILATGAAPAAAQQHPVADATGFQPTREYFSQLPFEHVDTFTGSLVLTFTDLVLSGNQGRDLRFQRTFNSKSGRWTWGLARYPLHIRDRGMPPVGTDRQTAVFSFTPFIFTADGALHRTMPIQAIDTRTAASINQTMGVVGTSQFWRYHRQSYDLYLADGTHCRYERDPADHERRRLTNCYSPHGHEEFTVKWEASSLLITQHFGFDNREVEVQLTETRLPNTGDRVPTSITFLGNTWTYEWGDVTRVQPPIGPGWEIASGQGVILTTPNGGQITYEIENQRFPNLDTEQYRDVHSLVLARKTMLDRCDTDPCTAEPKVWTYTYNNQTANGTTAVQTPDGARIVYHHESYPVSGWTEDDEDWVVTRRDVFARDGENWIPVQQETREYATLPLPSLSSTALSMRDIVRDGRRFRTVYEYADTDYGDYHRPFRITDTDEGGPFQRVTRREYRHFDPGVGRLNVGHLTREQVTVNGETFERSWDINPNSGLLMSQTIHGVTTTFQSFAYGNPGMAVDATQKLTHFWYAWGQLRRIQTPKTAVERVIAADGTLRSETRFVNSAKPQTTTFEYNKLRLEKITPQQTTGSRHPTILEYDDARGAWTRVRRGNSVTTTRRDGFGRTISTENGEGSAVVKMTTEYDAEGRRTYEGYPHTTNDIGTRIAYDVLGRVVSRTNPGGTSSSRTYRSGAIDIVDENNRTTTHHVAAFGEPDDMRLVGVTDANGKTWRYEYNALGKLTKVTAPDGKIRQWTYQPVTSFLREETHPESGTTRYTHDAIGNVRTKTDANGQTTTYDYDDAHRLVKVTAGTQVTYMSYEIGSDNRAWTRIGPVNTTFLYDQAGRPSGHQTIINGRVLETRYELDANDNMVGIFYPSLRRVGYKFDAENRITQVSDMLSGTRYAYDFTYHPSGAVTGYTAGNGIGSRFTYDQNRYWITDIRSGPLGLAYNRYDGVGNILEIDDARGSTPWRQTFSYDNLDRVTSATGAYGTMGFTYDDHGNMLKSGNDDFIVDAALRMTYRNNNQFTYDANGNIRTGPYGAYTYTPDNQMATATVNNVVTSYAYDADQWRAMKTEPNSTTYYIRGTGGQLLSEVSIEGTAAPKFRDYIYAGSRLLAVVSR